MNDIRFSADPNGAYYSRRFQDFEVSWIGPNPLGAGFCLGTENGGIVLTDESFHHARAHLASAAKESVNGVGFSQGWFAVSTRADVNLISSESANGRELPGMVCPVGGLGVEVLPSGYFAVPLGRNGMMFVKPGVTATDAVTFSNSAEAPINLSRILALQGSQGQDILVCAGRKNGLGLTEFSEGTSKHPMRTSRFGALDIVDVCQIAPRTEQFAVAAVGKDGTLVLFHDILTEKKPRIIKFQGVKGTIYRILSAGGSIYLLTSKGIFLLFRFAEQFLNGGAPSITRILAIPIPVSDGNLVGEKWLMATGANEVFRLDLDKMPEPPLESVQERAQIIDGEYSWDGLDLKQTDHVFI